jgi:hypothetical protein
MSGEFGAAEAHAEVLKLARILEREPEQLAYLERLAPGDLRELRERVTEALWSDNNHMLGRIAAASRLLPAAVSAAIAERAFGAFVSARLAGLLDPGRAVDVAAKLPSPFLADVAVELDPRRASEVIARIPPQQISDVTRELVQREEYVTMGRFVGHLSDEAVAEALGGTDDRSLLRVAFVLDDKDRLDELVGQLPKRRLAGIVQTAADDALWVEALDLLGHLGDDRRAEVVATALELDDDAVETITDAVLEHDLWGEVLVIAERDSGLQAKLAARLESLTPPQRRVVRARVREVGATERLGVLGEALERS